MAANAYRDRDGWRRRHRQGDGQAAAGAAACRCSSSMPMKSLSTAVLSRIRRPHQAGWMAADADVLDEQQVKAGRRSRGRAVWQHLRAGACRGRRRAQAGPRHRGIPAARMGLTSWISNLTSAFLAARAVVPLMRKRRTRPVVVFSSIIADGEKGPLTTVTGRLPYATAKAALLGFTDAACQGSGGVGHNGECADAGIDFRRTGHADSRQVRQSCRPSSG